MAIHHIKKHLEVLKPCLNFNRVFYSMSIITIGITFGIVIGVLFGLSAGSEIGENQGKFMILDDLEATRKSRELKERNNGTLPKSSLYNVPFTPNSVKTEVSSGRRCRLSS